MTVPLIDRVRDALAAGFPCGCPALRDLDTFRAKARAADLSLSPAGLGNAHYLLTELIGKPEVK